MGTYYSALKYLRRKETLDALAQGRVVAPVHVRVKPTNPRTSLFTSSLSLTRNTRISYIEKEYGTA
jgi:hypothetical protein